MEIHFCNRCGIRLAQQQFEAGEAVRLADGHTFCRSCVPTRAEPPPPEPPPDDDDVRAVPVSPQKPRKSSARLVAVSGTRRPPSSARLLPVSGGRTPSGRMLAQALPAGPGGARASGRSPAASRGVPSFVWIVGGLLFGLLLSLGLVRVLGLGSGKERAAPPPDVQDDRDLPKDPAASGHGVAPQPVAAGGGQGEVPFPNPRWNHFEANFDRQDLGGFGPHDFDDAQPPRSTKDAGPRGGGILALGALEKDPRYRFGSGAEIPAGRLNGEKVRVRFRYRLLATEARLTVEVTLEERDGPSKFVFEADAPTLNRWRWFDEPLTVFQKTRPESVPGNRLVLKACASDDPQAGACFIDDVLVYEPAEK
ncbi:MAG: hypothetical protein L6R28_21240 [Planctomycetes bacterium]|nr:hypothetical protein [Planctomycetota bacterium]